MSYFACENCDSLSMIITVTGVSTYHSCALMSSFLADRTIGRAFVTGCRLSVTFCIQAKRLDRFA